MANEKRLINVNPAYIQHILAKVPYYADEIWKFTDMTQRFPTVDAVEVVHGRWIFKHDPITDPKGYFIRIVCSECDLHTGQKSNYCPNCGADMRERKDK